MAQDTPYTERNITILNDQSRTTRLLESERELLARVARGGELNEVLNDIVLAVEKASGGELLGSILILSEDGGHLVEGAAPSLPADYNAAIHGIAVGPTVGSCGTAAFRGEPVFVSDIASDPLWADFKELALSHKLAACWSVPIRGADGRVLGTFANYYREPKSPSQRDIEAISMMAQTTAIAIERHRREAERAKEEEQRILLLRELNHRVKNLFALTNAIVTMTARSATSPKEMADAVRGRLTALARAHDLVQPRLSDASPAESVSFRMILDDILQPYRHKDLPGRIGIEGKDIAVKAQAITNIALVLHELATNAAKYGALSVPEGHVTIDWHQAGAMLELTWREEGGPPVSPPSRSGFGSMLTQKSVEGQFGGTMRYDWDKGGLKVTLCLPLAAITV
jgi:two-component sensor histidine kinase